MPCDHYLEAIHERVDGTLGPLRWAELQLHLDQCDDCRALLRDLERIRDAAAALPPLTPPPAAWPAIARTLRDEGRVATPSRARGYAWLAAAAALVLAAVTSVWVLRSGSADTGTQAAAAPRPAVTSPADGNADARATVEGVEEEFRLAEQHYQNAIARLEEAARTDQDVVDPQTAELLKKNLLVVDQAIAESRAALQTEPSSVPARESLFAAFKRKVALLQDTIALMNEMRKGNAEAAARIVNQG